MSSLQLVPNGEGNLYGTGPREWTDQAIGNILDRVDSPNGAVIQDSINETNTRTTSFQLSNTPADFATMQSVVCRIRYRVAGAQTNTRTLFIRIIAQSGAVLAGSSLNQDGFTQVVHSPTNTAFTNVNVNMTTINQNATKADWDGAWVEVRQAVNRNMGGDTNSIQVDAFEFNGTYIAAGPPTDAPTVTVGTVTTTSVQLNWGSVSGATQGYDIFRDGALVGSTTSLTYTDAGLAGATSYNFQVRAKNSAGPGPLSSGVQVSTLGPPATAPVLSAGNVTTSSFQMSWTAVSNVTHYAIYRDDVLIGTRDVALSRAFTDSTVIGGETYSYRVAGVNEAGEGPSSNVVTQAIPVPAAPGTPSLEVLSTEATATTQYVRSQISTTETQTVTREFFRDGAPIHSFTGSIGAGFLNAYNFQDAGLTPNTYHYYDLTVSGGFGQIHAQTQLMRTWHESPLPMAMSFVVDAGIASGTALRAQVGVVGGTLSEIDWGDGSERQTWTAQPNAWGTSTVYSLSKTYAVAGIYTITMYGTNEIPQPGGPFERAKVLEATVDFAHSRSDQSRSAGVFQSCINLTKVTLLNFGHVTDWRWLFRNCHSLTDVSDGAGNPVALSGSAVGLFRGFLGTSLPAGLDLSAVTQLADAFAECVNLTSLPNYGIATSFSLAGTALQNAAIEAVFHDLADVNHKPTQVIDITGTPGNVLTQAQVNIATAKNWEVVGATIEVGEERSSGAGASLLVGVEGGGTKWEPVPLGLQATWTNQDVALSWTEDRRASRYEIERQVWMGPGSPP